MNKRVAIVGAGPVGCLAAGILAGRGCSVDLYEKRVPCKETAGRTINLSLTPRGIRALDRFGLGDSVRKLSIPMTGRAFHPFDGEFFIQPYGRPEWQTYSVTREDLNQTLLTYAMSQPGVRVHNGYSCLHADLRSRVL